MSATPLKLTYLQIKHVGIHTEIADEPLQLRNDI